MYNLSLVNGTGLVPFFQTVNTNLTFGWFGQMILLVIGIVLLSGYLAYTNNFKKSLGVSSVILAVLSIIFRILLLVPDSTVVFYWVVAAVAMFIAIAWPD